MKPVGKPDAGNPHVRFDERGRETGQCHRARPRLYRSRARSGMSWSTPKACCCTPSSTPRNPGSRRRRSADEHAVWPVSVSAEALCRQRLSGAAVPAGPEAAACGQINVEIVKRSDTGKFVVLPKRWIVERTIAWLNRCRRLAKDWEGLNRNGLAFLRWASIRLMVRKLCQTSICSRRTLSNIRPLADPGRKLRLPPPQSASVTRHCGADGPTGHRFLAGCSG